LSLVNSASLHARYARLTRKQVTTMPCKPFRMAFTREKHRPRGDNKKTQALPSEQNRGIETKATVWIHRVARRRTYWRCRIAIDDFDRPCMVRYVVDTISERRKTNNEHRLDSAVTACRILCNDGHGTDAGRLSRFFSLRYGALEFRVLRETWGTRPCMVVAWC